MKKSYTICLSIINVISSFLLVSLAFLTKFFVDYVTSNNIDKNKVIFYIVLLIGIVLLQVLLRCLYSFIRSRYLLYLDVNYKEDIHHKLLRKEVSELNKYHSGEITNIYLNDIRNIEDALVNKLPALFGSLSRFIFSFIALTVIDYKFLLLLVAFGACASVGGLIYSRKMKKLSKKALQSDGEVTSFMQESLENVKIVKAFEVEDEVDKELKHKLDFNYKIKKKRNNLSIIGFTGIYSLMNVSYILCLGYGGYAIAFLGLSFGSLSALLQLVSYLEGPLSDFSTYLNSYATYKASKERINNLLNLNDEVNEDSIDDFDEIVFDNITFYYEKDKPVINNFSLRIKKDDVTIFKGVSGKGKTTLFMIMLGFIKPISGKGYILYNNKEYPFSKATRKLFSYVPQDNIIFSGTIKDNFKLLAKVDNDEEIYNALDKACLKNDILKMPLKLDTKLKERGQGLSTGQIQRILIAISILNDKKIMLLDEFTSSLDIKTEQDIVDSLITLNKTIIIISHRKLDLSDANEIKI